MCVNLYRYWLTRLLRAAYYKQSANKCIDSSSQASEGSGVLIKVLVAVLIVSNNFKLVSVKFNITIIQ